MATSANGWRHDDARRFADGPSSHPPRTFIPEGRLFCLLCTHLYALENGAPEWRARVEVRQAAKHRARRKLIPSIQKHKHILPPPQGPG
jgi:hypothetical protein